MSTRQNGDDQTEDDSDKKPSVQRSGSRIPGIAPKLRPRIVAPTPRSLPPKPELSSPRQSDSSLEPTREALRLPDSPGDTVVEEGDELLEPPKILSIKPKMPLSAMDETIAADPPYAPEKPEQASPPLEPPQELKLRAMQPKAPETSADKLRPASELTIRKAATEPPTPEGIQEATFEIPKMPTTPQLRAMAPKAPPKSPDSYPVPATPPKAPKLEEEVEEPEQVDWSQGFRPEAEALRIDPKKREGKPDLRLRRDAEAKVIPPEFLERPPLVFSNLESSLHTVFGIVQGSFFACKLNASDIEETRTAIKDGYHPSDFMPAEEAVIVPVPSILMADQDVSHLTIDIKYRDDAGDEAYIALPMTSVRELKQFFGELQHMLRNTHRLIEPKGLARLSFFSAKTARKLAAVMIACAALLALLAYMAISQPEGAAAAIIALFPSRTLMLTATIGGLLPILGFGVWLLINSFKGSGGKQGTTRLQIKR